jgi:hypothetical protein
MSTQWERPPRRFLRGYSGTSGNESGMGEGIAGEHGVSMKINISKYAVISTANRGDCEVELDCAGQYHF